MASGQLGPVLRQLHRLVGSGPAGDASDGQLLHRFVHDHEQAAFAALVQRHGPMVLGLCRRVLQDADLAEDAFQATFLVLVRKARSLNQYGSLGNWLWTVAYHLALRARGRQARRRVQERQVEAMPEPQVHEDGWSELRPVLDVELARLPAKYREPVVLCYLEGKSTEEAARELGWPVGTVKVRLLRARDRLRERLRRRGLPLAGLLLGPALASPASAAVSPTLLETTLETAALFAAGSSLAATGSTAAVQLAQGALKAMFIRKLQIVLGLLLMVGVLGAGGGVLLSQSPAEAAEPLVQFVAAPAENAEPAEPKEKAVRLVPRSRQVHQKLAQAVTLEEIQPNTPLKDALKLISDRYKVTILIDKHAFEAIGVQKPDESPVELPAMKDMRLATVLNKLLRQIKGDVYQGTYMVRPDHVEVTTTYSKMAENPAEAPDHPALRGFAEAIMPPELWGDPSRRVTPVVHVDVDHRPLAEALRDLGDDAEIDIIIDRRAAEKARTPVDLTLNNVLFDTAVGLLVDLADLDWMFIDNVVYVATKDDIRARKDRKRALEQEKLKMMREANLLGMPPGPVPEGAPGGLAPAGAVPAPPPVKPFGRPGPVPMQ